MTMQPRVIASERIFNLRDFGGYATAGGGRLRTAMLFRSGQHRDATAADLAQVDAMRLVMVCDLRGTSERRRAPCARPAGFVAEVIREDGETSNPALAALARPDGTGQVVNRAEAEAAMRATYAAMPFGPVLRALYARYLHGLARQDGPTLVHCMAGKDRTGFAVALVHHIAGVHPDEIMADYLLTNEVPGREAWIKASAGMAHHHFGSAIDDDALRALLSVDASYLEAAFAAIRERHGGLDAYLDGLGVDAAKRAAICERVTA